MVKSSPSADARQVRAQVQEYLAAQPPDARRALRKIRALIRSVAPGAVEVFSYGIPGYRFEGRPLVWCAGWTQHVSLYPIGAALLRPAELQRYETSKGTIRFRLAEPLPSALVKRLVKGRISQIRKNERVWAPARCGSHSPPFPGAPGSNHALNGGYHWHDRRPPGDGSCAVMMPASVTVTRGTWRRGSRGRALKATPGDVPDEAGAHGQNGEAGAGWGIAARRTGHLTPGGPGVVNRAG